MALTILSDSDVYLLLHSLTKDDIRDLQQTLMDSLHHYSTATNDSESNCSSAKQPATTSIASKDGLTTLFMPASSDRGIGLKTVTVSCPQGPDSRSLRSLSLSTDRVPSPTASTKASSGSISSSLTNVPSLASTESGASTTTPKGSLTLLNTDGSLKAVINAEELTAFRTALASSVLFEKRASVHDLLVFGAGKQAYWHTRLALLLRGQEIHHLNIVNRSFDRARDMIMKLYDPLPNDPTYMNPIGQKYDSRTKKAILTPSSGEYTRLLKEYVRGANVIFCTTPSTNPLFPGTYLTNPEGHKKGRYIACVGSYRPHMIELDPSVLKYAVAPHHEHRHFHKRQREGGAIVVDSVTSCLEEAGEIVQADLGPNEVVELGELVMLRREAEAKMGRPKDRAKAFAESPMSSSSPKSPKSPKPLVPGDHAGVLLREQDGLYAWLSKGNVIYKSVGLGLMDVVVGNELIRLAREKGIGSIIEDF